MKNLTAWPTVLVATVLLLLGCNDARPYFLTRNSAKHAIESQLGNSTELYFTTGRQIVFGQEGATYYLETEYVPGSYVHFLDSDIAGDNRNCVPTDQDRQEYPAAPILVCYHNWPTAQGETFFERLEHQGLLHRIPGSSRPNGSVVVYFVKIGDPVVNVTGIAKSTSHATVDFDLQFTNLNEMGKVVFPRGLEHTDKFSQKAEFTRYDDGWRVTKLERPVWVYGPEY